MKHNIIFRFVLILILKFSSNKTSFLFPYGCFCSISRKVGYFSNIFGYSFLNSFTSFSFVKSEYITFLLSKSFSLLSVKDSGSLLIIEISVIFSYKYSRVLIHFKSSAVILKKVFIKLSPLSRHFV